MDAISAQREMVRQFKILQEEAVILGASPGLKERIDTAAEKAAEKLAEMERLLNVS